MSTNSQDLLGRLKKQREEEGDNPFALFGTLDPTTKTVDAGPSLTARMPGEGTGAGGGEENPFAMFGSMTPGQVEPEVINPAGQRFVRGVGRGIIHPVRAFLPKGEGEPDDLGLAGMAGEFVGMGVSFVPFFKGANFAIKGIGLLKTPVAAGVAELTTGGKIVRGATAFAGFEAFGGETIEEAPKRVARGFVEGLAFEAGLAGIAAAWRGSRPAWKATTPTLGLTEVANAIDAGDIVHPLALKLEYAMRVNPSDSPEVIAAKMKELGGTGEEQIFTSLVKVMENHAFGGQLELSGLKYDELNQLFGALDTKRFNFGVFRPIKGGDTFNALVVDRERVVRTPWWEGKRASIDKMQQAILDTFDNVNLHFPKKIPGGEDYLGMYVPRKFIDDMANIYVATGSDTFQAGIGISTLLHEAVHHITWVAASARTGKPFLRRDTAPVLDDIFAAIWEGSPKVVKDTSKLEFVMQMRKATEAVVTRKLQIAANMTASQARQKAIKIIAGDVDYYHNDRELLSRMSELMLLEPDIAQAIAPLATRLVGDLIQQNAPKVRALMSKEAQIMVDLLGDLWRTASPDDAYTIFTLGKPMVTKAMLAEYSKTGWAPGLRAMVNGRDVELIALDRLAGTAKVRNLTTGVVETVDAAKLQRPTIQALAQRNEAVVREIDKMLDGFPASLPMNLAAAEIGSAAAGTRQALLDTSRFLMLNKTVKEWFNSLPEDIHNILINKYGQLRMSELRELDSLVRGGAPDSANQVEILKEALQLSGGYKGIIRRDHGMLEAFVSDPATVSLGMMREGAEFGRAIAGREGGQFFYPSLDDWLRQSLREKGVVESDIEHFFQIAKRRLGERLEAVKDLEVRQVQANVTAAKAQAKKGKKKKGKAKEVDDDEVIDLGGDDTAEQTVTRAGLQSDRLADGRIELRDAQTKSVVARVRDMDEAAAYANDLTVEGVGDDLGDFVGAINDGGAGRPKKLNEPLIPSPSPVTPKSAGGGAKSGGSRLIDSQTLMAPMLSALENFAKAAERQGFGPAYTRIYLPAHNAMLQVHRELSVIKRDALGGLTFGDKLTSISDALVKVPKKRYSTITGYIEASSQEEIAQAGGLMTRAMTQQEVKAARFLEHVGLQNDVPRLQAVDRLVNSVMRGNIQTTINKMKTFNLSPEAQELLAKFEAMPKFKSRDEVMDFLGLSKEERDVINNVIRYSKGQKKDEYSIYAVSRYASAPKLKKGFKSGREMFAVDNKMTDAELLIAKLADETLGAAFKESGLDSKRFLTGYWPHLRMWTQEGFTPDSRLLPDDVGQWIASRFRSGELNVYETDPLATTYKHIRGLYMKQHFDPLLPEMREAIKGIEGLPGGSGVARNMSEYLLELMGRPHASFESLQGAIERVMVTLLGKEVNPRLAQDVVNGLSAITSAAFIPFRPGLIARNFFESLLKVSPRTGVSHYFRGLNYVVGAETRKEAFEAAMKAGAIRPSTQRLRSLHSAEEMFGPQAPRLVHKYLQIFDKGFSWYQSADDWGRAIAFHSQRLRVMDHMDDYMKGRITMEQFKSRGKVNMYDPLDVEIFEKHILDGNHEKGINHLGQVLSRETMTRYGYADHPVGWNSVQGRLLGQFGTWPVQYKDYLLQGISRGSWKDRAEFAGIHSAVSGSIILAGASIGADLTNWTGMQMYAGGPYADLMIDLARSVSGSDTEKTLARNSLYSQIPVLGWMETGNPRSMFIPGSYLAGDLGDAKNALMDGEVLKALMEGGSLRVMRPEEKNPLDLLLYRF